VDEQQVPPLLVHQRAANGASCRRSGYWLRERDRRPLRPFPPRLDPPERDPLRLDRLRLDPRPPEAREPPRPELLERPEDALRDLDPRLPDPSLPEVKRPS
jgi:hypothetical protein